MSSAKPTYSILLYKVFFSIAFCCCVESLYLCLYKFAVSVLTFCFLFSLLNSRVTRSMLFANTRKLQISDIGCC